jgi:hypothetical protein
MDKGQIAEFDTPQVLFKEGGIFYVRSSIFMIKIFTFTNFYRNYVVKLNYP